LDTTHNEIAAITNVGAAPADALLTLHYDDGSKKYELKQTIQPGDQMWVNFADLVHKQTPDSSGNTLPADLTAATYDVQDLTPQQNSLMASSLSVNSTFGNQVIPQCPVCCAYPGVFFDPESYTLIDESVPAHVEGISACTGRPVDLTNDFSTWWSGDSSIASVTKGLVTPVAPGYTTAFAQGYAPIEGVEACGCPLYTLQQVQAPVTVDPTVSITGSPGVPLGHSAGFSVSVGPNPDGVLITISITTTTGSGDATFNSGEHATTLGGGATLPVNGNSTSSTANNLLIKAVDTDGNVLASETFSVVSVTLSLRSGSGVTPSASDSAAGAYESKFGTDALSAFADNALLECVTGVELVGHVAPTNYSGAVVLRRTLLNFGIFYGSTSIIVSTPADDTSDPLLRDDNPQASSGYAYDLDAPGVKPDSGNVIWRVRQNFSEYAVLDSATNTTPVSNTMSWYSAVSCITPDFMNYSLSTGVSGDNQTGLGTVNLNATTLH
jgi:hypothetical protein